MGEWLRRELQRQTPGRAAQPRNLLFTEGGADHHRRLEKTRQHPTTSQRLGLPAASAGTHYPNGFQAKDALIIKLDHPQWGHTKLKIKTDQSDEATQPLRDKPSKSIWTQSASSILVCAGRISVTTLCIKRRGSRPKVRSEQIFFDASRPTIYLGRNEYDDLLPKDSTAVGSWSNRNCNSCFIHRLIL